MSSYFISTDPYFGAWDYATSWLWTKKETQKNNSINTDIIDLEKGQDDSTSQSGTLTIGDKTLSVRDDVSSDEKLMFTKFLSSLDVRDKPRKKESNKEEVTFGGRCARFATAAAFTTVSGLAYNYLGFSPIFAATVPLMNRGLKALFDLAKVDSSCETVGNLAKKYIPFGMVLTGAVLADIYIVQRTPVTGERSLTQFVASSILIMAAEDYTTWMYGGKNAQKMVNSK